ncbi:MAG: dihydrolipoyllysine-residue acetyltransferase [Gammaproteobacteria bacterium]|nr:MAG: dihydrolipoyllysine-residue acetyltransferase [Gammaproteobacteria bacterium]
MSIKEVTVPDLGGVKSVDVIEICVKAGDQVNKEDIWIVVESDKATVEVPSPFTGTVESVNVKEGDSVKEGAVIGSLLATGSAADTGNLQAEAAEEKPLAGVEPSAQQKPSAHKEPISSPTPTVLPEQQVPAHKVHAGPAVRRLARKLGVNLVQVPATGPRNRILKEDVYEYVKQHLTGQGQAVSAAGNLPELPDIDFSRWGDIETEALSKLKRVSGANLHRSWLHIPHVTQFDEADITDLETFRKSEGAKLKNQDIKLTFLPFLIKAVVKALQAFPRFNSSLANDGNNLIYKKYINIGIAVDTPEGLVVPVVKNPEEKSLVELAEELVMLSAKARDKKLSPADMQGGTFTISSLGGIGGTAFTPIVNWPEVSILGVSRSSQKPVFADGVFVPRLMLPLSLSYDHRVIDGADAARFTGYLANLLQDIRRLLL